MGPVYKYNDAIMALKEIRNGDDIEFHLTFYRQELKTKLLKIKEFFDQNDILTDLLIYTHSDKHIQVIVRKDFYLDFLLQLFKQQLLEEIKWEKEVEAAL